MDIEPVQGSGIADRVPPGEWPLESKATPVLARDARTEGNVVFVTDQRRHLAMQYIIR
jgi:hypothetical protein